jgi:hypothetical protein
MLGVPWWRFKKRWIRDDGAPVWEKVEIQSRFCTTIGAWFLTLSLPLLLISICDSFGYALNKWGMGGVVAWIAAGLASSFVVVQATTLTGWLGKKAGPLAAKVPLAVVLDVVAFVVLLLYLVVWTWLAYAIIEQTELSPRAWLVISLGLVLLIPLLFSIIKDLLMALPFINGASLLPFYSSRLRRAYLGASNPERYRRPYGGVSTPVEGDDIGHAQYTPWVNGGPLHLINVTINETVAGESGVMQLNRLGVPMAVGPAGVSVGVVNHAGWSNDQVHTSVENVQTLLTPTTSNYKRWWNAYRAAKCPKGAPFKVFVAPHGAAAAGQNYFPIAAQSRTLGEWVAISGAAFSTGVGKIGSRGLSVLALLFNVRLGYWWNSGIKPWQREGRRTCPGSLLQERVSSFFGVFSYLLDEFSGTFYGTNREYWNLSDGGHFDNTGCYELLRRRLKFILLCDCGADPEYLFEDLAYLAQKARVDFAADIDFLTTKEVDQWAKNRNAPNATDVPLLVQPLVHLRRGEWQKVVPPYNAPPLHKLANHRFAASYMSFSYSHSAMAKITYADGVVGYLLVVKPTVTGDEATDVLFYHETNNAFPQQTTVDQFFDESQWESYRWLGRHTGEKLAPVIDLLA